jgi:uncharacterized membrane protein
MDVWELLRYLHVLAVTFFVGGQLVLVAAVVPVLRGADDPEPMRRIARKFGHGTLVAFAILISTGAAMASHFNLWSDGELQLKLGLFAVMIVFLIWHTKRPKMHALEGAVFLLSLAIVWLGILLSG